MMRRFVLFITAALAAAFLCGSAWAAPSDMAGDAVTDRAGRSVTAARPFTRIISLYTAHTENLLAMGAGDALIGISRACRSLPGAGGRQVFSTHDGPERFLVAKPDLVLIRPMIDNGYPDLVRRLEKSGVTVLSLQPAGVDEMLEYWRILGKLAGKADTAERMAAQFQKAVADFTALTDGVSPRKQVYFEAIHDRMKTFSPGAMALFVLETAGGVNVATDAIPSRGTNIANYGKERILAKSGAIDVYLAQTGPMNRPSKADILAEPGYSAIKAVREGSVYLVEEDEVSRPTFRVLEGVRDIGRILYPDRFDGRADEILERAKAFTDGGSR